MTHDIRRITLVCRGIASPDRRWNIDPDAQRRVIFVDTYNLLKHALRNAVTEYNQDLDRVILDRSTSAAQFLDLLAHLPHEYTGDVLLVRPDDSAYLSAISRGDGRMFYALEAADVEFYLQAHGLVAPVSAEAA